MKESVNQELLREDERRVYETRGCYECEQDEGIELLRRRLIEARKALVFYNPLEDVLEVLADDDSVRAVDDAEVVVAKVRLIYDAHNDGRECLCPYCVALRPAEGGG